MADVFTGITVWGLYDNVTESPLFAANGTAVPTSSILIGGSDGVNIQPLSVDSSGRLNVNASSAPPTDSKANATINGDGTGTQSVQVSTEGTSQLQVQTTVAGGYDGTLTFQSSLDGTTWHNFVLYPVLPDGTPGTATATTTGQWQAPVGGMRLFRATNTPGTTGTITVYLTAGQGQYSVIALSPNAANFNATVTVSGTASTNLTQVGGSAITLGQKTMANSFPVVIASDQTAYPVNIQASGTALTATGSSLNTNITGGTVSATQGTTPWVNNLTQVAGVALGATAVTAFGTAPAAANVPGVNASLYAGVTGITATGSSLNTNVTNTVTVTGTVAVTQSTSPWIVAGNKTNNAAVPGATNVGVLPAVASTAAPTYTDTFQVALSTDLAGSLRVAQQGTVTITGTVTANQGTSPWVTKDQADGATGAAVPAQTIQVGGSDGTNLQTLRTSTAGTLYVIPADEAKASSLSYYSVDNGNAFVANLVTSVITPLVSIRSSSATFIYLVRSLSTFTDGSQVLFRLYKNPTLTGATFAATAPTGSHVNFDTAATAVTAGQVVWSGYTAASPRNQDALLYALAAGTPGDVYTLAAEKFGSGTAKAAGALQWSEQSAVL